jgi:Xaa-Pro aminopeptidase
MTDATARRASLEAAEARGMAMLDAIEQAGIIRPGRSETDVDQDIFELARDRFGVEKNWHKRLIRAGPNTICVFADLPDVRVIEPEDTVYLDLGPVFEEWEADLGRSYALGSDPEKKRLVADLPRIFSAMQSHYRANPDMTGGELYRFACEQAEAAGWLFGGQIAGHIIGEFPHAVIREDKSKTRIAPINVSPMSEPDPLGRERFWIGEVHLVDKARTFGGFYERLM